MIYPIGMSFFDLPDLYRFGRRLGPLAAIIGFLAISGFSIAHSYSVAPTGFYLRRAVRIFPTLGFAIALYAAGLLAWGPIQTTGGVLAGMPPIPDLIAPFLALNGITHGSFLGPTWSLAVEMLFYVLTPLIALMPRPALLAAIAASATLYWFNEALGIGTFPGNFYGLSAASLFWAWGGAFYFYRFPSWLAMVGFSLLGVTLLTRLNLEGGVWSRQVFVLTVVVIAASSLSRWRARLPERFMMYLGDLSYPLFLLHVPVIVIGNGKFGIESASLLILIALGLSSFCLHFIERPIAAAVRSAPLDRARRHATVQ